MRAYSIGMERQNPMINLQIRVYHKASGQLLEEVTNCISNLVFETQVNGGFYQCSFTLGLAHGKAWEWYVSRHFARITVHEGVTLIWEGRVEDVTLRAGGVDVTALGYWASLDDDAYFGTPSGSTSDQLTTVLQNVTSDISTDYSMLQQTGYTPSPAPTFASRKAMDMALELASYGDGSGTPWHLAVWDGRRICFCPRSASAVSWRMRLEYCANVRGPGLMRSVRNLANRYYSPSGTILAQDMNSQARYHLRSVVKNVSGAQASAAVTLQKDIPQSAAVVISNIDDANGSPSPLYRVRAGQVIRIDTLAPPGVQLSSTELDALTTFYIRRTRYDADHNELSIWPDQAAIDLVPEITRG